MNATKMMVYWFLSGGADLISWVDADWGHPAQRFTYWWAYASTTGDYRTLRSWWAGY